MPNVEEIPFQDDPREVRSLRIAYDIKQAALQEVKAERDRFQLALEDIAETPPWKTEDAIRIAKRALGRRTYG